jgi:hypothetical protein
MTKYLLGSSPAVGERYVIFLLQGLGVARIKTTSKLQNKGIQQVKSYKI